jgi:type II secretory pathway predicted ATPase ExeA
MYAKDFGLCRRPFPPTPDRTLYYPATSHETALASLLRAVAEDEGFALLTGAPGTGKTLLCHCLFDRLGENTASAFLTNSHFPDRLSIVQAILFDFALEYEGSEQVVRLRLTDFLLKNCASGRRAVVVVDEAHHLPPDLLEELRLLGNLEAEHGKAFQVILVGQDGLLETLARPEMASCNQRLAVRARLEPMGIEEGVDYLMHHIRLAGGRPEAVFDETALEILARGSGGVPRLLNQTAHQALSLAHEAEMNRVDAEAALEALAVLGFENAPMDADTEAGGDTEEETRGELLEPVALGQVPVIHSADDEAAVRLFESPRPA